MAPWGVSVPESLENFRQKDSLNTLKDFLNTFFEFENSYHELYCENIKSKAAQSRIEMKIGSLMRRYGTFSTYMAMTINLFSEDANLGDLELISAFLVINQTKLKEFEENLIVRSHNIYNSILQIHLDLADSDIELKNFSKNFRQNASIFLMNRALEQGSKEIFLYSGFPDDVITSFETCNYNIDRFTDETIKNLNLYFKSKILGMRGLNYVQSLDH